MALNPQQQSLIQNSLYGTGSLTSNSIHAGSIQSNITKALSLDPNNQSLKAAQAAMQSKNYAGAQQNLRAAMSGATTPTPNKPVASTVSSMVAKINNTIVPKTNTPIINKPSTGSLVNKIVTPVINKPSIGSLIKPAPAPTVPVNNNQQIINNTLTQNKSRIDQASNSMLSQMNSGRSLVGGSTGTYVVLKDGSLRFQQAGVMTQMYKESDVIYRHNVMDDYKKVPNPNYGKTQVSPFGPTNVPQYIYMKK
jgi:hypothetical protein